MTTFRDQLADAVADVGADTVALTRDARRRGLARRRQRLALAVAGATAAVVAVGAGLSALDPTDVDQAIEPAASAVPTPTAAAAAAGEERVPITGRSTAAILVSLVNREADAQVEDGSIRGQGDVGFVGPNGELLPLDDTYAEAMVDSPAGRSLVTVNVQDSSSASPLPVDGCPPSLDECAVGALDRGDILRTYTDNVDKPGTERLVVEMISPARDLRVVVAASSPHGARHALTLAQLTFIASDPAWGQTVATIWDVRGEALAYTSIDSGRVLYLVEP